MDELEAVELLDKLKSFMMETTRQIETLIFRTQNLQIDIDKLKKHFKENKIITI